jgi:23S rRNA G2069 N7-methylase RlmK/C1962 C5-methylase RlmI
MASKRTIKKILNGMVFDVVDECFSIQLYAPTKTEKTDKLIEEVLDFRDTALAQIHQAKSKKDYAPLHQSIEDKGVYFVDELNGLQ